MFRASKKQKQLDIFTSIPGMLKGSSYDQFTDNQAWHNMFREHVVNRVDENMFKSLFSKSHLSRYKHLMLVGAVSRWTAS